MCQCNPLGDILNKRRLETSQTRKPLGEERVNNDCEMDTDSDELSDYYTSSSDMSSSDDDSEGEVEEIRIVNHSVERVNQPLNAIT